MSDDFIDSNVFVYLFDETDERKRQVAQSLVNTALVEGSAQIIFQVVQETLNVITRKLKVPVRLEDAHQFLDQILAPLWKINPNCVVSARAGDTDALSTWLLRQSYHSCLTAGGL